jgi:hypothetical protein
MAIQCSDNPRFLVPDWPSPARVHSVITTRHFFGEVGPTVDSPHLSINSSLSSGKPDEGLREANNILNVELGLNLPPQWLYQEHDCRVIEASADGRAERADACYTDIPGLACAVLSADCLPILISAKDGSRVAAVHAGWRGMALGVIPAAVVAMDIKAIKLMAYLGPAICAGHYQVGQEVRQAFLDGFDKGIDRALVSACFERSPASSEHYHADLYQLARIQLKQLGITDVYGGNYCTYGQQALFYSYRLDESNGRMASLIWIER